MIPSQVFLHLLNVASAPSSVIDLFLTILSKTNFCLSLTDSILLKSDNSEGAGNTATNKVALERSSSFALLPKSFEMQFLHHSNLLQNKPG